MQSNNYLYKLSNSPIIWILLFIAFISPLALNYILHYIDELHYTDAAIQMLSSHDYFSPKQANGEFRFLKPILSYWMIVSSYQIFGISQFSSRLPFLLCGAMLLWITFRISLKLTTNKEVSLLSVLIVASNPLFILSSSRSIPDIPQALFLSIGMLGIAGILASGSPKKKDLWLFYLGFSLAFATKGIPAAIFMFISILFLVLNPWKKIRLISLINWPAIITSLAIAFWWYISMYIKHGNDFLISFFNDQVGERISEDYFRILKNLAFSILTIFGYFIFWTFPFYKLRRRIEWLRIKNHSPMQLFSILILCWISFLFFSSIFTVKFYDRYFLPVFPLMSIIIAFILYSGTAKATNRTYSTLNTILTITGTLLSAFSIFIATRLGNTILILVSFFTLVIFPFIYQKGRKNISLEFQFKNTALLLLLLTFSITIFISIFAFPDQGSQIAAYLKKHKISQKEILFYGEKKVAAKIRVACEGEITLNCMEPNNFPDNQKSKIVLFREDQQPGISISDYQIQTISTEWKTFPVFSFLSIKRLESSLKNHQINYKIATPCKISHP